jgi:hypothetical protein
MGGMTGAILIILMVAAGAYFYWRTSNSNQQAAGADGSQLSWKEKYLPWGNGGDNGGQTAKNPDDDSDEFHDEEAGTKSATNSSQHQKSWSDAFYDKVMELPSPSDLKMMMFKKGLSQNL